MQVFNNDIWSALPEVLIDEICLFTGKFILRFDKKINKKVLVDVIDLKKPNGHIGHIDRMGHFTYVIYYPIYSINIVPPTTHSPNINQYIQSPDRRRRGEKKRYKMGFIRNR